MDGLDSLSTLMWNAMHPLNVILVDSIALLGLWRRHRTNMEYSNQTKIITGSSRSSIQSGIASLAWMVRSNRRHIRYRTYQQLPGQKRANRKSKENQGIGQHLPLANEECVSYG
ncbi:1-phosphofructokinase [Trichinella spiralis]|uniref:1-phosphofructokinase n=1 Tax=Trichinella spiralis TaxID=6334 RepID=A0ABR3KNT1_TRISP